MCYLQGMNAKYIVLMQEVCEGASVVLLHVLPGSHISGDTSPSSWSCLPVEWEEDNAQNWESGFFLYLIEEIYLLCKVRESNVTFILTNVGQRDKSSGCLNFRRKKKFPILIFLS